MTTATFLTKSAGESSSVNKSAKKSTKLSKDIVQVPDLGQKSRSSAVLPAAEFQSSF